MKNYTIKLSYLLSALFSLNFNFLLFSQSTLNPSPVKKILSEYNFVYRDSNNIKKVFNITFNQNFFINSNLNNLENQNGLFIPKGFGSISGFLVEYSTKNTFLSIEPRISALNTFRNELPYKEGLFSVLNDVSPKSEFQNNSSIRNVGIKLFYDNFYIGYGNWDSWWGPGIHNSLSMSNNALGFYHFSTGTEKDIHLSEEFKFNFNYLVSSPFENKFNKEFFLTSLNIKLNYLNIEFGARRDILSGGYTDIGWSINEAFFVPFTNLNIKYWNQTYSLYTLYESKITGLKIYYEIGIPKRFYDDNSYKYSDHSLGSNIGLRKYGAFGKKEIMFGFEYTRLLQSSYYNILPSPNWYDDIRYNFTSFYGRRWTAHSGSDSDDLLILIGYINKKFSLIYGLNYERHGVTYVFPPEVKIENRISATYQYNNLFLSIRYEKEYFEHYGFVDNNINVWNQTFEDGSLQRTSTILLSLEKALY